MIYRLYFIIITIVCIYVIYRLIIVVRENKEINEINREILWNNFKLQTKNKNLYYLYVLEKKEDEIRKYFYRHQLYNIAVYGMDEIGKGFVQQFINAGIEVCYGIDRSNNIVFDLVEIRQVENIDDQMDIIIVAAEMYFSEIKDSIKIKVPIRKLSEVCEEILVASQGYN